MACGDLVSQFDTELRSAALNIPDRDREPLFALWKENLERRQLLRDEVFSFDEAPADPLLDDLAMDSPTPARNYRTDADRPASICDASLALQARLLARGEISSLELTDAYLARIEREDPRLRSFVTVDAEGARRAACQTDVERARGAARGQLHGIPVAVKDMIAVAGLPMTAGSRLLTGHVSERDAAAVMRLREAGAVLLGTNTLLEFGSGPYLQDGPQATGVNPWDPTRIPGGSSSGSGIAVAAGLCSAALGTDTAGSVRMPAAYNGVVGLKPTRGRISLTGVVPFCWSLDTVGTLTRSVEDAALVLDTIAETARPRRDADAAGPGRCEAGLGSPINGLRIGVLRRTCVDAPDVRDDVRIAFNTALEALSARGAVTTDVEIPEMEWNEVVYTSFLSEAYALHAPALRADPDKFTQGFRLQLYAGGTVTIEDIARARLLQGRMTRAALAAFKRVDVLAFPGQAAPAPLLSTRAAPALTQPRSRFTRPWNIVGLPVLALPCGQSVEGLPLSIHLAGRPFDETTLLRVGYQYQQDTSWHYRRPPR